MLVDIEKIKEAKEKLGDRNADMIADLLQVEQWDPRNRKGLCPFHNEDTPSFIYNPKQLNMKCFGCGKNVDIIDAYMATGKTYIESVQKLFEEAEIQYSFGEHHVKSQAQYKYPKEVICEDKSKVYAYLKLRGISQNTADYLDIREEDGNIVFNYYDTSDVLTMVKYRPARKIAHGETKNWCQKGADTMPLLYNMNRINVTQPLAIFSGELDCAAAIEAGYQNSVSIPLGDQNTHWVETCWEWLEQFDSIIICPDNDASGMKYAKEIVPRLGSWRCKTAVVPDDCKDANEVLYRHGKEALMQIIQDAKDNPVESVEDFSDIQNIDIDEIDGIKTGFRGIDKRLMKLFYGTFTIVTGVNGCVSADTEYFNGRGWKPISEYEEGDLVLEYTQDGEAKLVEPLKYHKYPAEYLWHIKSAYGVDQMVSDEHNLVYLTSKDNLNKISVEDMLRFHEGNEHGFYGRFLTTFKYDGPGLMLTDDQIRLMCAVICDGHIPKRKRVRPKCRMNLKKERKKKRLRALLERCGIPYDEKRHNPKDLEFVSFFFDSPLLTKVFDPSWYFCSQHQLEVICDEIMYWDGHLNNGKRERYSTTVKQNADFIQFVFSACGYRSHISVFNRPNRKSTEYEVSRTKQIYPRIVNVKDKIHIPKVPTKDGFKYCFTVPSGMLVLRHNGRINITGNSGKSSFLSSLVCNALDENKNVFMYSGELPNFQTKNWINYIFAGQRHVKEYHFDENVVWKIPQEDQKQINEYYRGKLFIYKDGYDHKASSILNAMESTCRKYGCKLFVIDNLTSVNLECNEQNKYQKQEEFTSELIAFAKKYNVAVVEVIHPHKIETMRRLTKMDVQGVSALIDLAHRIISLYRVTADDKRGLPKTKGDGWIREPIKYDVLCDVLKDRMLGFEGTTVGLYYDRPSRRFFETEEDLDRRYNWDTLEYDGDLPYPPPQLAEEEEVLGRIERNT